MKKLFPLLFVVLIAFVIAQCKKNDEVHAFYVTQSRDSVNVVSIFVNGLAKGHIPYRDTISDCATGNHALVELPHGKNMVELRNSEGKAFYSCTLTFRKNSYKGSTGMGNGGQMMTNMYDSQCHSLHFFGEGIGMGGN